MKTVYYCDYCDFHNEDAEKVRKHEAAHHDKEKLMNEINAKIREYNDAHKDENLSLYHEVCPTITDSVRNISGEKMANMIDDVIARLWR